MTSMLRRVGALALAGALLAGCGGGGKDAPIVLTIEGAPARSTGASPLILSGQSFVPEGSSCPSSSEFIIIGILAAHTITFSNAANGTSGPVFSDLWVCNSGDGRSMSWTSNPISLQVGTNVITVTMSAGSRSSSATITVTRTMP